MIRLLVGDCRERLKELPDASVQMVVTSPPYFGLRDYQTGTWAGGDPDCDHVVGEMRRGLGLAASPANTRGGAKKVAEIEDIQARADCPKCGAARQDRQIGLEAAPEAFVAAIVEVFHQVRRVLRDDGTIWLNLGDSYASRPNGQVGNEGRMEGGYTGHAEVRRAHALRKSGAPAGLKHKDMMGIPWRVAFALQADGWWLRQDIIWHKPNPMPESVIDRCTKAHEYVFLLSKSARYYFDAEAIAEPIASARSPVPAGWDTDAGAHGTIHKDGRRPKGNAKTFRGGGAYTHEQAFDNAGQVDRSSSGNAPNETGVRNKRSVWTVATTPFKEAHFATYPPELIEPCILAGSPVGGLVLDPFGGAGTTALVADRLQRDCVLIELNPAFAAIAERRISTDAGMFHQLEVA